MSCPQSLPGLDPATLRHVFGAFPTGVTAVAGCIDGVPVGVAANSFTSVSLDPPLVSVAMGNGSQTWPRLRGARRLGISVLAEGQEDLCRQLSRTGVDRFAGHGWQVSPYGAVFLDGTAAWLECTIRTEIPAGDHHIVLLDVHRLGADTDTAPLVFHGSRFRRLSS
jgi:flavin reductase (DIM6/NTAB) family NADH-FMN oxidoreductase RutF